MADTIDAGLLGDAIAEAMREYTEDVVAAIPVVLKETAKEAVKDLRQRSPKLTGDYAAGWDDERTYSRDGHEGRIIRNETDYQITHLLEFGHARVGGGRVEAIPHVGPVADEYHAKLTEDLGKIVMRGGL